MVYSTNKADPPPRLIKSSLFWTFLFMLTISLGEIPSDIVGINKLTMILKIIGQFDLKYIL